MGALKAADREGGEGGDDRQYEDPNKLARHGRRLQQRYAQPGHSPSPYELPVSTVLVHWRLVLISSDLVSNSQSLRF